MIKYNIFVAFSRQQSWRPAGLDRFGCVRYGVPDVRDTRFRTQDPDGASELSGNHRGARAIGSSPSRVFRYDRQSPWNTLPDERASTSSRTDGTRQPRLLATVVGAGTECLYNRTTWLRSPLSIPSISSSRPSPLSVDPRRPFTSGSRKLPTGQPLGRDRITAMKETVIRERDGCFQLAGAVGADTYHVLHLRRISEKNTRKSGDVHPGVSPET